MAQREEWIVQMLNVLLGPGDEQVSRTISLDEIGQAIGDRSVSTDDIEALFVRLESRGAQIGDDEEPDLKALLRQVIQTALALRKEGLRISPSIIAERSGLSLGAVRVALLYSEVLRG